MAVSKGDRVVVEYEGRFEDGEVFDSSAFHQKPLEFVAGAGMVVPGFDRAVIGMEKGEEKEVRIEPKDAYGEKNPAAIQKIPKVNFPPEAEVGMTVGIPLPGGGQAPAKIVDIGETDVTLDLNHPLAGKTLIFKIKLVE